MPCELCDLVILGSGFAASLLAIIARRLGKHVVMLERFSHPRFAIGESSTPLANLKLETLADRYGLDWLKPLTEYGSWKRAYPQITCGPKRGFSFFSHDVGKPYWATAANDRVLLVAANPDLDHADTHWYRSEFDAFLVDRAIEAGVSYFDHCTIDALDHQQGWGLTVTSNGQTRNVLAPLLIDGSGDGQVLARFFGLTTDYRSVRTSSRTLFSHFKNVARFEDIFSQRRGRCGGHPFPCDAAALHHLIDGGWMWVLRLDNGITSAGFSLDPDRYGMNPDVPPDVEWDRLLSVYPSIQAQFRDSVAVRPIVRTGRLQRRLSVASGTDWAILPHGAAFVDPWLSSGIAHSLWSVERLARMLEDADTGTRRASRLEDYGRRLLREFDLMDSITAACFARRRCFPVLVGLTMCYFVAATYSEEQHRAGSSRPGDDFLLAHDERFVSLVHEILSVGSRIAEADADGFLPFVADRLAPYNRAGLCDPDRRNMYPFLG